MAQGAYFVNTKTDEKFAVNGCQRSSGPLHCEPFCNYVKYSEEQLPETADLRRYMSEIEDQRHTNTW